MGHSQFPMSIELFEGHANQNQFIFFSDSDSFVGVTPITLTNTLKLKRRSSAHRSLERHKSIGDKVSFHSTLRNMHGTVRVYATSHYYMKPKYTQ